MGLLDALIYGVRDLFDSDDNQLPRRSRVKFNGTVTDDPGNDRIVVDVGGGGGGGSPGSPDKSLQTKNGGAFKGLTNFTQESEGHLQQLRAEMSGSPELIFVASTKTLQRGDGSWVTDGFATGKVTIAEIASPFQTGNNGVFTITSISTTSSANDTLHFAESVVNDDIDTGSVFDQQIRVEQGGFVTKGIPTDTYPSYGAERIGKVNEFTFERVLRSGVNDLGETVPVETVAAGGAGIGIGGSLAAEDTTNGNTKLWSRLGIFSKFFQNYAKRLQWRRDVSVFKDEINGRATTSGAVSAAINWSSTIPTQNSNTTITLQSRVGTTVTGLWTWVGGSLVSQTGGVGLNAVLSGSTLTVTGEAFQTIGWFAIFDLYGTAIGVSSGSGSGGGVFADTVADLRLITGNNTSKRSATLGGYYSNLDGGGGEFLWDSSSSTGDNGGTIIVPTGSSTGRWVRPHDGHVNVKWFGAKGDGTTDDTSAIQAAIDFQVELKIVWFPGGSYRIVPPSSTETALFIGSSIAHLRGMGDLWSFGSTDSVSTIIVDAPGNAQGCGVLIETIGIGATNYADNTHVSGIRFIPGTHAPEAYIVIHAVEVVIETCSFVNRTGMNEGRWGVIIDSAGSIITIHSPSVPAYVYSDSWRVLNCMFNNLGNASTGDMDPLGTDGGGLVIRGDDSGGGYAGYNQANACNVSFGNSCQIANEWEACYSQVSRLGYFSTNNTSTWVVCGSEDTHATNFGGTDNIVLGGSIAFASNNVLNATATSSAAPKHRFSPYCAFGAQSITTPTVHCPSGIDPIRLIANGLSQDDILGGWSVQNTVAPSGIGTLTFRRTSDATTMGAFGDLENGWWGLRFNTTDAVNLTNYSFLVSDDDTDGAIGPGKLWFPKGFYIGNDSDAKRLHVNVQTIGGSEATNQPTTAGAIGEIRTNAQPAEANYGLGAAWQYTSLFGWVELQPKAVLSGLSIGTSSVNLVNSTGNEIDLGTGYYAYSVDIEVVATSIAVANKVFGWHHKLLLQNVLGTATIYVDNQVEPDATLKNGFTWTVSASIVSGSKLRIQCVGETGEQVEFKAYLTFQRVAV